MRRDRRVEFEKFVDPFLPLDEQGDEFDADNDWAFARRKFLGADLKPTPHKGYFLSSAYTGVFALGDNNLPSRQHKLFVAHTNFRLTAKDEALAAGVDGVEGYRTLTPYRFLLGVGWMFGQDEVKAAVRGALCPPPPAPPPASDPLARAAAARFPAWAVVRLAGGRRDLVGGPTDGDVDAKLSGRADVVEVLSRGRHGGAE